MKVILLQDDKKLGKKGDIVNASDGFAFNSLIPRGIAKPATTNAITQLDKKNAQIEKDEAAKLEQVKKDASKIDKKKVTIKSKAKDSKLFGSVTSKEIAKAITKEHGVAIAEENILLEAPIKELTTVEVRVDYGSGVSAGVIVTIAAE